MGVNVLVRAAHKLLINISATLVISKEVLLSKIVAECSNKLSDYLYGLGLSGATISYTKVLNIFFTEGVEDITNLKLNDSNNNIMLSIGSFASVGTVNINA